MLHLIYKIKIKNKKRETQSLELSYFITNLFEIPTTFSFLSLLKYLLVLLIEFAERNLKGC